MHALAGAGRVVGGRYRLRDLLGRGAMGAVWRARDELLDRDVAVKEVKVPPALSERDRSALYLRTLREAKTAARLSHRGVVTVFDVVEEDGRPWIVMELVRARSLDQVLAQDGPLPAARAADIGHQLVSALATAHAAGILHRDVKPSNVLLAPDGRAVLTDFGIATFEGDERLTQTGMVMGTPAFTPPERIRGEPATPSSDLWSLGATLYAAIQGKGPFGGRGDAITTMNAVLHEDPPAAPSAGPLGPVISALMHRDPAARPEAARASQLLSGALRSTGPAAGPADNRADGNEPGVNRAGDSRAGDNRAGDSRAGDNRARPDSGISSPTSWNQPATQAAPLMYSAPASDTPPGHSFHSAPVSDTPPHSPPGHSFHSAPVSDAPPRQPPREEGPAGTGGAGFGHAFTWRRSRHGGRVVLTACAALVIVAAGVAGGFAIAHSMRSSPARSAPGRGDTSHASTPAGATGPASAATATLPNGYGWYSLPAASAGTTAGFRLAVPQGWDASTNGLTTYLRDPAGGRYLEVDLTRHTRQGTRAEARWLEVHTVRQGKFPGYRRISIRTVRVSGSAGAVWSFTWQQAGTGRVFAQDYLFDLTTGGGSQSYAVYASAPAASWRRTAQMLAEAIHTFRPLT